MTKARHKAHLKKRDAYFLAQASHDLRQPLQALGMYIDALSEEKLNPTQRELINKIETSMSNLKNMLNNVLDISQIKTGKIKYKAQHFDIKQLLERLCIEYSDLSKNRNIKFRYILCSEIIKSDSFLLERIIRNLLSNAFKYAQNKVFLGCRKEKEFVRIVVIDDGWGINIDDMPHIFEDFFQSSKIENNRNLGAGLGLSISQRLAQKIDTKINVTSIEGKGSCFSFRLKIKHK